MIASENETVPKNVKFVDEPLLSGISSTRARELIQAGQSTDGVLNPAVKEYIQQNSLYPSYPKELQVLQNALHEQGFAQFCAELKVLMLNLNLESLPPPAFEPAQSPLGRVDGFMRWIIEQKKLQGEDRAEY